MCDPRDTYHPSIIQLKRVDIIFSGKGEDASFNAKEKGKETKKSNEDGVRAIYKNELGSKTNDERFISLLFLVWFNQESNAQRTAPHRNKAAVSVTQLMRAISNLLWMQTAYTGLIPENLILNLENTFRNGMAG